MMGLSEIQNPSAEELANPPATADLPSSVLYSSGARFGGSGLDTTSLEGSLASHRAGILGKAIGYANNQNEIPAAKIQSLAWHPVRALSFLDSRQYYGAKRRYVDWVASRKLATGKFDCFHGWSGDCMRSLMVARQNRIPSIVDIPTWHRNKGRDKPFETKSERERRALKGWRGFRENLEPSRQRTLMEYELADVIHVQSLCAAQTFIDAGIEPSKVFYVGRGVDVERFQPAVTPDIFRLVYVGALIKRKGVHHLLEAWHRLRLKDAELLLVGHPHDEIKPYLKEFGTDSVRLAGFSTNVQEHLRTASAFTLTSECEGSAKVCYEAAACALPQISTYESGDVVIDGLNGSIIPPNDVDALADAIRDFYDHPEKLVTMGKASRERVVERFTWDHYRVRVLHSYGYARKLLC